MSLITLNRTGSGAATTDLLEANTTLRFYSNGQQPQANVMPALDNLQPLSIYANPNDPTGTLKLGKPGLFWKGYFNATQSSANYFRTIVSESNTVFNVQGYPNISPVRVGVALRTHENFAEDAQRLNMEVFVSSDFGGSTINLNSTRTGSGANLVPWTWSVGPSGAGVERMRITTGRQVLFNTTAVLGGGSEPLQILSAGAGQYDSALTTYNSRDSDPGTISYFPVASFVINNAAAGQLQITTNSFQLVSLSDHRRKKNVRDIDHAVERIMMLQPRQFQWSGYEDQLPSQGFVAHELATVIPHAVTGSKDAVDRRGEPVYQMVNNAALIPALVAAVKQLRTETQNLKLEFGLS